MSVKALFPLPLGVYHLGRPFSPEEITFTLECYKDKRFTGVNGISNNSYVLNSKEMTAIKAFVENSLDQYLNEADPFPDTASLYITQSWFTFTEKDQYHHIHNHPNSYVSGVLYFNVDPSVDKIYFKHPYQRQILIEKKQYTPFNCDEWTVVAEIGKLLLFPSYIDHYVKDYHGDRPRISLAFNTFIKGQLGSDIALTGLKL